MGEVRVLPAGLVGLNCLDTLTLSNFFHFYRRVQIYDLCAVAFLRSDSDLIPKSVPHERIRGTRCLS